MKKTTLGRILIIVGVLMWVPFGYLKMAGTNPEVLPFLALHLMGVIPGAILAPGETAWAKLGRFLRGERNEQS